MIISVFCLFVTPPKETDILQLLVESWLLFLVVVVVVVVGHLMVLLWWQAIGLDK